MTYTKQNSSTPFVTGDEVRLKTGDATMVILEVDFFHIPPRDWVKYKWGGRYKNRQVPCGQWYVRACYKSSLGHMYETENTRSWREATDHVLLARNNEPEQEPEKEVEPMAKLYQTKDKDPRFGTFLTKNSNGHFVLEMKGENGKVEAFPEDKIEEVLPYTIELSRLGVEGSPKGSSCHVIGVKGQVKKDDVLLELNTSYLWRVTKLNSVCRSPKENKSKWLQIPVKNVTFGEQ